MRPRIPEMTRNLVIEKWLQAKSRNAIAEEVGIGRATVSAMVEEWSQSMGKDLAFQLRDFILAMHRSGLSLSNCITGFRIALCSKNLGISLDEPEHFLRETYAVCLSKGLEPRYVAQLLEDLVWLSEGLNSISAMSDKLWQMKDERESLTSSIKKLKEEIAFLHAEKEASVDLRNAALENARITQSRLDWFRMVQKELEKYRIPVDDVGKFAKTVKGISEAGYDAREVVSTYSKYHNLKSFCQSMQANLDFMENNNSMLEEKYASLEKSIAAYTQTISQIEELARNGIGLRELLIIRSTIAEIAKANGLDSNSAWIKFNKDLERYDAKLGFDREIQEQTVRFRKLNFNNNYLEEHLGILVADSFQTKMGQEHKLSVAKILNDYPNIFEGVATRQEQRKINDNDKKKNENKNVEAGREHYSYDNGDIAGFEDMMEDSKNHSPDPKEEKPKDLPQDQVRHAHIQEVIEEMRRLQGIDN